MFRSSERLNAVVAEIIATPEGHQTLSDMGNITTGYDNDGSTGVDMVEIGIVLGTSFARKGAGYHIWLPKHPTDHVGYPVIAKDEAEALLRTGSDGC